MDAKAVVKLGELSRGGKSRVPTKALDHDYPDAEHVTPVGILLPQHDELYFYMVTSKVTADCLVDCLEDFWQSQKSRFPLVTSLVLNLDNGPECNSRRSQFMARMVALTERTGLAVQLAYYPPYHSKYNPVERGWGVLENHWNGSLLDSVDAVVGFASSMTWKGAHPAVQCVTTVYESGVKLAKDAMKAVEDRLSRLPDLGKWFVKIRPIAALEGVCTD